MTNCQTTQDNFNKLLKFFILLFFIFLSFKLYSQPKIEWVGRYADNNLNHITSDADIDENGNVYLTGTVTIDSTNKDIVTLKYSNSGILLWAKTYDGLFGSEDEAISIKVDKSGNIYVAGTCNTNSAIESVVLKYSQDGDTIWTRRYVNSDSLFYLVKGIATDSSNSIYVLGDSWVSGQSNNILLTKYDLFGNLDWQKEIDGNGSTDFSRDIVLDKNDNIAILAQTGIGWIIVRYNSEGDSVWGVVDTAGGIKLVCDSENNLYNSGRYYYQPERYNFYISKYNLSGNKLWVSTYNNIFNLNDYLVNAIVDINDNLIVTGLSTKTGELGWDYLTIKYNPDGDSLWVRRFNPVTNSNDEPVSIGLDVNNNVFVTGKSDRFQLHDRISTVSYNALGQELFVTDYDTNTLMVNHLPKKSISDTNGNIYIAGISQNSLGKWNMVIIKYSPYVSNIKQLSNSKPESFVLYQNYPNPFNNTTTIKYRVMKSGSINIKVFDLLGKETQNIVNSFHTPGDYSILFESNSLSSGIYYYRMDYENTTIDLKKFILLK